MRAWLLLWTAALGTAAVAGRAEPARRLALAADWKIESSADVADSGDAVSRPGYRTDAWQPVRVPNTVVGGLVEQGRYPDPYFGMNLRAIPGTSYPIGKRFTLLDMPADSPFRPAWWYRTEFELPSALLGRSLALHFDGINYRADIWVNGVRVAGRDEVVGAFRRYEFDATRLLRPGERNAIAAAVLAPEPRDLAFMWVDWNPTPADKNMGLWGDVYVTDSGPIALRRPHVVGDLELPGLGQARVSVSVEAWNTTDRPASGIVRGAIEAIQFARAVTLAPREHQTLRFTPDEVAALAIQHPRVWWPYRMGTPELYTLALDAEVDGALSDRQDVRFGIQKMTSELTPEHHRLFRVNGKPILVRGGGWASDMLFRPATRERLAAELRYVKEMGLNTIRLEGKLEGDLFYDLADAEGILVMPGWCCCDQWEQWDKWDAENHRVARASLSDQILRLRNHPSVLAWLNGSDEPPRADVERDYLGIEASLDWPKPILSSANVPPGATTGPSGVRQGPYDYEPPMYWLTDTKNGGAFGFDMEAGPGPAVPPVESLRRMLPPDHLWPIDDVWNFHAGGDEFKDIKHFTQAIEARYGTASGLEDYVRKAQALAYDGQRAMFEAYGRNKYRSTGIIQWMLNNAWPSLIWHLYDYYLRPGGGYYGTKKACEPLHVQFSYDDRSVVVVNDLQQGFQGLRVSAQLFDLALARKFSGEARIDVAADAVARAFVVPKPKDLTTAYFLRLGLDDASGRPVSSNFYWLSTREDVLDWKWTNDFYYYTPTKVHGDLTALARLAPTSLALSTRFEDSWPEGTALVGAENTGQALGFQVHLKLVDAATGEELLPVFWDDNYFELFPGERREIRVTYPRRGDARPLAVEADAWNAPRVSAGGGAAGASR